LRAAHAAQRAEQYPLLQQLVHLLRRHDEIEATHLYPLVRERTLDTSDHVMADRCARSHRGQRDLLDRLEGCDIHREDAFSVLGTCLSEFARHVHEEEHVVFALVRSRCGPDELREIGRRMAGTDV
jgi:hemerythrin-like domain-containing protein